MAKIAIIKTGGKQYKVKEGDTLVIEKVPVEVGKKVSFQDVLLVAEDDGTAVQLGKPVLSGAKVEATIVDQYRDKKLTIYKFKNKVRYRRKQGHRQHHTEVKIDKIA